MKMTHYKFYFLLALLFCFHSNEVSCIDKIVSEHYKVQEGDNVEKIIQKKIWFNSLKEKEKKLVIKQIKDWNPQITNWNKLKVGTKLYLEFPRKWSREYPLIMLKINRLAKGKENINDLAKTNKNLIAGKQSIEKEKRSPSSESGLLTSSKENIIYQKNPYQIDVSLGYKIFAYVDKVSTTGTILSTSNNGLNFDLNLNFPVNEKLGYFFGLDATSYGEQECEANKPADGTHPNFCINKRTWDFPITYSLQTGLRRSLFSKNLKRGLNWSFNFEREEFSYLSISKDKQSNDINIQDGAKFIFAMKSVYLWLTAGLGYNFSIWEKQSQLSLHGSYCISGESNLRSSQDGYWEELSSCIKFIGEYKQYIGKSFWLNGYIKILNSQGKFDFSSTHNGWNLGYTF